MILLSLCLFTLFGFDAVHGQRFLAVQNGQLRLNGEKVFLSGMNIAWNSFGSDFGNGRYDCCTGSVLEDYLRRISAAGGNSIRIWLHCAGDSTPNYDGNGYITGTDSQNTMISDLSKFLDAAYSYNILVFFVLWNGATNPYYRYNDLFFDESKLQSYIDNALTPMASALKDKVSLGGWEIMNEPEGMIGAGVSNSNPCFDTNPLSGTGAGWVGNFILMQNMLRFLNRQIAAIKAADPKVLVTVGSWSERGQTDQYGYRNYYTDKCLSDGGGQPSGTIDLQQMHTWSWQGAYSSTSPLNLRASDYNLSKPNLLGEFSQSGGDGRDITSQFDWAYKQGYCGAWSWQANGGGEGSDNFDNQARGVASLRGRNDQNAGGRVDIILQ